MSWQNRIRRASYKSPRGLRINFTYEDVSSSVDKKTAAFDFPDADGTFIQDLGHTGKRYPLRIIFWGPNYDIEAAVFEEALLERGVGRLEHPIYGVFDVVPFGAITRRDDLKTAGNQAIIEVTFWETINLIYPTAQQDPSSIIREDIQEYNNSASQQFLELLRIVNADSRARFKNDYLRLLDVSTSRLAPIANSQEDVKKQFDTIDRSISNSINLLVSDPLTLGLQTCQLLQSPARAQTSITARLVAYGDLSSAIVSGEGTALQLERSNDFHTSDLYASTAVTGSVLSVINTQFETKTGALSAAETILAQLESVIIWREANFENLDQIDTGEAYQQLQQTVALAAGFLVQLSFSLKQERSIVIDRNRTIIDLAAELYGTVDADLDFLIESNNLSGSEILELQRGREIVYYV